MKISGVGWSDGGKERDCFRVYSSKEGFGSHSGKFGIISLCLCLRENNKGGKGEMK